MASSSGSSATSNPVDLDLFVDYFEITSEDDNGNTPLHNAAKSGHFEIFKAILKTVKEKNPQNKNRMTPLHLAARSGHAEICGLIMNIVEEKNPLNENRITYFSTVN